MDLNRKFGQAPKHFLCHLNEMHFPEFHPTLKCLVSKYAMNVFPICSRALFQENQIDCYHLVNWCLLLSPPSPCIFKKKCH